MAAAKSFHPPDYKAGSKRRKNMPGINRKEDMRERRRFTHMSIAIAGGASEVIGREQACRRNPSGRSFARSGKDDAGGREGGMKSLGKMSSGCLKISKGSWLEAFSTAVQTSYAPRREFFGRKLPGREIVKTVEMVE
jgi:hypothetical protein